MVEKLQHPGGLRLLLTPNRSLSWRGNVRIWLGLVALCALIATGWTLAGAWLVIPFAGLELLALAIGFYLTSRACQRQEVITLAGDTIVVEKGRLKKLAQWTLPRPYTRLSLQAPAHPFAPGKLCLRHRDLRIPLGTFLNTEDTNYLIDTLTARGLTLERVGRDPGAGLWL